MNKNISAKQTSEKGKVKETIIQLLSNLANPKEFNQYMTRFVEAGQSRFAVIKVGGAILDNDLENLCSSLAFLEQIGLFPIVVHGAGPQLNRNLEKAGVESTFIEGQRVTDIDVLKIAKKTFIQQNLKLKTAISRDDNKTNSFNFTFNDIRVFVLSITHRKMANDSANFFRVWLSGFHAILRFTHFARSNHLHSTGDFLSIFNTTNLGTNFFSDRHTPIPEFS